MRPISVLKFMSEEPGLKINFEGKARKSKSMVVVARGIFFLG